MSAFIVSEKTMLGIVNGLTDPRSPWEWEVQNSESLRGLTPQQIGQALFGLNVRAVDGRYDEKNAARLYAHVYQIPPRPVALYKALRCLIYQCTEDPAMSEPLYKDLERIAAAVSDSIVSSLPEWEKAAWG